MGNIELGSKIHYSGSGYLDSKITPVATKSDLNSIPRSERVKGLTVTVLDDGTGNGPRDYWLKNGTGNNSWVVKESIANGGIIDCGEY